VYVVADDEKSSLSSEFGCDNDEREENKNLGPPGAHGRFPLIGCRKPSLPLCRRGAKEKKIRCAIMTPWRTKVRPKLPAPQVGRYVPYILICDRKNTRCARAEQCRDFAVRLAAEVL